MALAGAIEFRQAQQLSEHQSIKYAVVNGDVQMRSGAGRLNVEGLLEATPELMDSSDA